MQPSLEQLYLCMAIITYIDYGKKLKTLHFNLSNTAFSDHTKISILCNLRDYFARNGGKHSMTMSFTIFHKLCRLAITASLLFLSSLSKEGPVTNKIKLGEVCS